MWHEKLPENCPPEEAESPDGFYYRLVKNKEPISEDFVSLVEEGVSSGKDCKAFGVSLMGNLEDAKKLTKQPRWKKLPIVRIAKIKLNGKSGVILDSPSRGSKSHKEWWRYKEYMPNNIEIIEGNEENEE